MKNKKVISRTTLENEVAKRLGYSKQLTKEIIGEFFKLMDEKMTEGYTVKLVKFGSFCYKYYPKTYKKFLNKVGAMGDFFRFKICNEKYIKKYRKGSDKYEKLIRTINEEDG